MKSSNESSIVIHNTLFFGIFCILSLTGSGPSSTVIWIGDVGGYLVDWTSPGELPSQVGDKADGDATSDTDRWEQELPPTIRCPAGDGQWAWRQWRLTSP